MNYIQLGDVIATAKVNRCGENDFPVLSITKSDGIVLQSEKFKKRIASKDTADYKVVHRGQLVQGIHIDEANFGIQEVVDVGIVSPAYKIWNIKSNMIAPKYLEIVLRSPRSIAYYASKFNGSIKRRERLSDKEFLQMRIPCPAVEEQIYAIEVLNKAAELIGQRRQQLIELDNLIKARFVEMFGDPECNPYRWPRKLLSQIIVVEPQNGMYKPQSDYVHDGSGIPILRIDAFYNGKVTDFRKLKRLNCSEAEKQRYLLREHDIVINRVNSIEYLGKCAHICGIVEDTVFESNMMRFHLDESVMNAVYATHFLCSRYIYNQILRKAKKAVNQASINQGDVLGFEILVPPLAMQDQFATFVEQVDKSKVVVQKALDEAQTLFDSLMQEYFG